MSEVKKAFEIELKIYPGFTCNRFLLLDLSYEKESI